MISSFVKGKDAMLVVLLLIESILLGVLIAAVAWLLIRAGTHRDNLEQTRMLYESSAASARELQKAAEAQGNCDLLSKALDLIAAGTPITVNGDTYCPPDDVT